MKIANLEQLEATNKVYKLRKLVKNDIVLARELGLTKPTMYKRLRFSNWKLSELVLINSFDLTKYNYAIHNYTYQI